MSIQSHEASIPVSVQGRVQPLTQNIEQAVSGEVEDFPNFLESQPAAAKVAKNVRSSVQAAVPSGPATIPSVSRSRACELLGVGSRRLHQLTDEGRLELIGSGHQKRVSVASLNREVERRRKLEIGLPESGNQRDSAEQRANTVLDIKTQSGQNGFMFYAPDCTDEVGELLSLSRAAAVTGISEKRIKKLIDEGFLPAVVATAGRRLVNSRVLRAWAQGQLVQRK